MTRKMKRREFLKTSAAAGVVLAANDVSSVFAQEFKPIQSEGMQEDLVRKGFEYLESGLN